MTVWKDWEFTMKPPEPELEVSEEQTPLSHPEEKEPTGCFRNCYLCGVEVARLPKDAVVGYLYTKARSRDKIKALKRPEKYIITYCGPCYLSIYPNK